MDNITLESLDNRLGKLEGTIAELIGRLDSDRRYRESIGKVKKTIPVEINEGGYEDYLGLIAGLAANAKYRDWTAKNGNRFGLNRNATYAAIDKAKFDRDEVFDTLFEHGMLKRDCQGKNTSPVRKNGKLVRSVVIYNNGHMVFLNNSEVCDDE